MNRLLAAFAAGLLFGLGLVVSQMVDPAKVLAFLDFAGAWDPSLAFVMGAAIPVAWLGFALAARRARPLLAEAFSGPARTAIDARLVVGSMLFGAGWGLAGYCPGPALASLSWTGAAGLLFLLAMLAGMAALPLADRFLSRRATFR